MPSASSVSRRKAKANRSAQSASRPPARSKGHRPVSMAKAEQGSSSQKALAGGFDLIERVKQGLAFTELERFHRESHLPMEGILKVVGLPPRTLARRKAAGRLNSQESERLVRLQRLVELALELFDGRSESVAQWMTGEVRGLGYRRPIELAETELGAREVEHMIGRLEHGVFS